MECNLRQIKQDVRIQNTIIKATGMKVSDDIRLNIIFDSIFSLLNNPEPTTYIEN